MRKSLEDIAFMVKNKSYPYNLPADLAAYHYYITDVGHSIMCVLQSHLDEAQNNIIDDYEIPVPVKYVLENGYQIIDGYVIVNAAYNSTVGLIVDERYLEF